MTPTEKAVATRKRNLAAQREKEQERQKERQALRTALLRVIKSPESSSSEIMAAVDALKELGYI